MSSTKKKTTTKRKTATKTTRKKSTRRRRKSWETEAYTYHTPVSVVEKDYQFDSGEPPDTKIGDLLKRNGYHYSAKLLKK